MRCADARRLFTHLLDERLAPEERAALAAHLTGCDACGEELERWRSAALSLRARGPTPVPAGLAERAWRAATEASPSPPLAAWFVGAARRAALAGAIATAAVWLAVLARGGPSGGAPAETLSDPVEVAMQLWMEGGDVP